MEDPNKNRETPANNPENDSGIDRSKQGKYQDPERTDAGDTGGTDSGTGKPSGGDSNNL